jgi:SPP1 family predicted phage head-tail adaptor
MRSGDLRHRISIQKRTTAQDTYGAQQATWTDVLQVWAHVQPLSGRELIAAQAVQSETTHSIVIRYNSLLWKPSQAAAMRVLYAGRVFNITASINEDERNRMLTLAATEGLNNG